MRRFPALLLLLVAVGVSGLGRALLVAHRGSSSKRTPTRFPLTLPLGALPDAAAEAEADAPPPTAGRRTTTTIYGVAGPNAERLGPELARRTGGVEIVLEDLLRGKKGRKTEKVKAEAIGRALLEGRARESSAAAALAGEVADAAVLRGFPATPKELEALEKAGVHLDQVVLLRPEKRGGEPQEPREPQEEGKDGGWDKVGLTLIDCSQVTNDLEGTVQVILGVSRGEKKKEEGKTQEKKNQTKSSKSASTQEIVTEEPWYAAVAKAQQPTRRRGGRSQEAPQVDPSSQVLLKLGSTESVDWSSGGDMEFGGLKLRPPMSSCLQHAQIAEPTPIQSASMLPVYEGKNVILHAMTGSGKTLAFLLPILARVDLNSTPSSPLIRVIVVVPTRELAVQVSREAALLMGGSKAGCVDLMLVPEKSEGLTRVSSPILVGTAKALEKALRWTSPADRRRLLGGLECVVCDEIDRLVDSLGKYASAREVAQRERHPKPVSYILDYIARSHPRAQIVACSATVGRPLSRELARLCNTKFEILRGAEETGSLPLELGASETGGGGGGGRTVPIPPTIRHTIFPIIRDDTESQIAAIIEAVEILSPRKPLLFLSDEQRPSRFVLLLNGAGLPAVPLHEAMGFLTNTRTTTSDILERHDELDLRYKQGDRMQEDEESFEKSGAVSSPMLVASQAGARGLHFEGVDVVFIVGRTSKVDEYVHIAGRTGRGGSPGCVVSILTFPEAKSLKSWGSMLGIEFRQFGSNA